LVSVWASLLGLASASRSRAVAAVVIGAVAAAALVASLALASSPPQITAELREPFTFASRAHIETEIQSPGVKFTARGEYAPALAGGEAPPPPKEPGEAPWSLAASGKSDGEGLFLSLGARDETGRTILHHLKPATTYYARFVGENENGQSEREFKFVTTTVTPPEVAAYYPPSQVYPEKLTTFRAAGQPTPRSIAYTAQIENDGAAGGSVYVFEYAPPEAGHVPARESPLWKPFSSSASGTVTQEEDFANPEAGLTGLTPESTYYVRIKMSNEQSTAYQEKYLAGGSGETDSFTTPTARPIANMPEARNVTGDAAHLRDSFKPNGSEALWRFEYASAAGGPWSVVPGGEGTVSQARAEALEGGGLDVEASLSGLKPDNTYYVRLFAENKCAEYCGEGRNGFGEPILTEKQGFLSFGTFGAPRASTFTVHSLDGEALRLVGSVDPNSVPTSGEQRIALEGAPTGGSFTLSFKGQTTGAIPFDASAEALERALESLAAIGQGGIVVSGEAGGPYTVFFTKQDGEVAEPQISGDGAGLTPAGSVAVQTLVVGGEAYDTHYHFEYVSQSQFEAPGGEGGFAKAVSTASVDAGSGEGARYVAADLPVLRAGETYRFRLLATNTSPGDPVVPGEEALLRVPAPAAPSGPEAGGAACANEAFRTGPSALLPDCRAYEQLTPADKGGAQEIYNYAGSAGVEGAIPGEDGEHLMYASSFVKWGSGPDAGDSPYFFSRDEAGWQLTAGAPQPEAGVSQYRSRLLDANLSQLALEAAWNTSPTEGSPNVEYKAGPAGGPYSTVASVPIAEAEPGWVAASEDFSKLILQVGDHTLLGASTHTAHGDDLYEYSGGELRQVNVTGARTTIGSCGASIVKGVEGPKRIPYQSSRHAVSADGARVFFEAAPGGSCDEAKHLYVRVGGGGEGAETLDLGAYRFLAANSHGTNVLLEKASGEDQGLYLYDSETKTAQLLPSSEAALGAGQMVISEDLSAVYFIASDGGTLYRYDVPARTLRMITRTSARLYSASADGRYLYFQGSVVALPSGEQVYRYDNTESLLQCVSCASGSDPEPKLGGLYLEGGNEGVYQAITGTPRSTVASANGDYVFFDTAAALLPSDVDGEVAPAFNGEQESTFFSVSSDVYAWRRDGVDGCSHIQGCLGLITTGRGGYLNILIGTTESGRDVFFATSESLLPSDKDTSGDIYDARIGGGFPQPPVHVECEGDSCSTPTSAPSALTPASATFQGEGNLTQPPLAPIPTAHAQKAKPKPRCKATHGRRARSRRRCPRTHRKRAGHHHAHRAAHKARTGR